MLIRMLASQVGSVDGLSMTFYLAGEKYDIPESLASVFLREGWAEEDKELVLETKVEQPGSVESVLAPIERMTRRGKVRTK